MTKQDTVKICRKQNCTEPEIQRQGLCPEHKNEYQREYAAAHREGKRESNTRYFTKVAGKTYLHTSGYVMYVGYDHPACAPGGITRHHRIVLWDKVDGQNVPCAECGGILRWDLPSINPDSLCVDHINEDKSDNRPENLDPIHSVCNVKRANRNAAKRKAAEEVAAA